MISVADFGLDANVFYFGKTCLRSHFFKDNDFNLRYVKNTACVQCIRNASKTEKRKQYSKDYYLLNREKILAEKIAYGKTERGKEVKRLASQKYRKKNPETYKQSQRKYFVKNRISRRLLAHKYYARKRKVTHSVISASEIQSRIKDFNNACAYCGKTTKAKTMNTLDHFFPITKGGFHSIGNIIPACRNCNSSKRNDIPHEWYQKQSFYSKERWDFILSVLKIPSHIYEMGVESMKAKSKLT